MNQPCGALGEIYAKRRRTLAKEESLEPQALLEAQAGARFGSRRSFSDALKYAAGVGIIGEVKFASPSRGRLIDDSDPLPIANRLGIAGVDAISIVTEQHFFGGHVSHLQNLREHTGLPLLRKDFLTTPYEIIQSAAYGADAVLLIVSALDDAQLRLLQDEAQRWNLDVVLEVHAEGDLWRVLALEPSIIGVNNRDLRTFEVDLRVSERLLRLIPKQVLAISESGLTSARQVHTMVSYGARACLIGEALLRAAHPTEFVAACRSVLVA